MSASQSRCATSSRRSPQSSRAWHGHEQEQARGGSCVDTRRDLQRGQARTRRQHGRPRATRSAGLRATQYLAGGKWRGARGKLSLPLREQARVQRDREVVQTTRHRKPPFTRGFSYFREWSWCIPGALSPDALLLRCVSAAPTAEGSEATATYAMRRWHGSWSSSDRSASASSNAWACGRGWWSGFGHRGSPRPGSDLRKRGPGA